MLDLALPPFRIVMRSLKELICISVWWKRSVWATASHPFPRCAGSFHPFSSMTFLHPLSGTKTINSVGFFFFLLKKKKKKKKKVYSWTEIYSLLIKMCEWLLALQIITKSTLLFTQLILILNFKLSGCLFYFMLSISYPNFLSSFAIG